MTIDKDRVAELSTQLKDRLSIRLVKSRRMYKRAEKVLPLGVPSSFQALQPHPIYVKGGKGSKIVDVDGNEYSDFHNGFGVMVMGHAHPAIAKAIAAAARKGTHFAAPHLAAIEVAEELARRFRLPKVRFNNSGTEATMDAIHLARGFTGKDVIVKIEGSYHGHHGAAMVSVRPPIELAGPAEAPYSVPYTGGIPQSEVELTVPVPFNDPDHLRRLLAARNDVAAVIIEPIMLNIGVVMPKPGYLEALREITNQHNVLLIFDEVKTGVTIAAGGVVEHFGVVPDLVCLAKAIGGGTPIGAVLGRADVMELIAKSKVKQLGTFNGNPLSMAAAKACLTKVLTGEAYDRLEHADKRLQEGCGAVIERYGLPAYTAGVRAKGCVMFATEPITDYRSWAQHFDDDLNYLGWLYHMNNGVFMAPGGDEQWTLSIALSDEEIDHYVAVFDEFARDITRR